MVMPQIVAFFFFSCGRTVTSNTSRSGLLVHNLLWKHNDFYFPEQQLRMFNRWDDIVDKAVIYFWPSICYLFSASEIWILSPQFHICRTIFVHGAIWRKNQMWKYICAVFKLPRLLRLSFIITTVLEEKRERAHEA